MAGLCYTGGFITRFHAVMNSYRLARNRSWMGRAAAAYDAKYEALNGRLWILGGVLNELEGAKGHLEALL